MAKRPKDNPCYKCARRAEGCHVGCEDGRRWDREHQEWHETVLKGRAADRDADAVNIRRALTMQDIKRRIPKGGGSDG